MAQEAINTLDNTVLGGLFIRCKHDRTLKQEPRAINERSVFVSNINWSTTEADVIKHLEVVGLVTRLEFKNSNKRRRCSARVEYMDPSRYNLTA